MNLALIYEEPPLCLNLNQLAKCTALSFNRPLSLWLLSESKYRRVRLVALYHFVTLTSTSSASGFIQMLIICITN
ncbi:MAG: hypothetical protein IKP45_14000, partial [Bacteroidales bacterium]|nr:hypothetical protein [Bacteroidales bacterium]